MTSPRVGSSTTTARLTTVPVPRIPTCGWLMIGVSKSAPRLPVLVRVNVPPDRSSGLTCPALVRAAEPKPPATEVEDKFGGMLKALQYGAPPHGGIAPGIDRIVMLLAGAANLRVQGRQGCDDPGDADDRKLTSASFINRHEPPLSQPAQAWRPALHGLVVYTRWACIGSAYRGI